MYSYATANDFATFGLRDAALPSSVSPTDKENAIAAASEKAGSYMRGRFRFPLVTWGMDLTQAVCQIAAFELVAAQVGFNPESGQNMVLLTRHDAAIRWLEQVSAGRATPAGIVDSAPSAGPGGPASQARASSKPRRGW